MLVKMATIYLRDETKSDLYKLINRSRENSAFGSPKRLKNPDRAIKFLLDHALRYDFDDFWRIAKIPSYVSTLEPEIFDNEELRNKIISEKINELEKSNE